MAKKCKICGKFLKKREYILCDDCNEIFDRKYEKRAREVYKSL